MPFPVDHSSCGDQYQTLGEDQQRVLHSSRHDCYPLLHLHPFSSSEKSLENMGNASHPELYAHALISTLQQDTVTRPLGSLVATGSLQRPSVSKDQQSATECSKNGILPSINDQVIGNSYNSANGRNGQLKATVMGRNNYKNTSPVRTRVAAPASSVSSLGHTEGFRCSRPPTNRDSSGDAQTSDIDNIDREVLREIDGSATRWVRNTFFHLPHGQSSCESTSPLLKGRRISTNVDQVSLCLSPSSPSGLHPFTNIDVAPPSWIVFENEQLSRNTLQKNHLHHGTTEALDQDNHAYISGDSRASQWLSFEGGHDRRESGSIHLFSDSRDRLTPSQQQLCPSIHSVGPTSTLETFETPTYDGCPTDRILQHFLKDLQTRESCPNQNSNCADQQVSGKAQDVLLNYCQGVLRNQGEKRYNTASMDNKGGTLSSNTLTPGEMDLSWNSPNDILKSPTIRARQVECYPPVPIDPSDGSEQVPPEVRPLVTCDKSLGRSEKPYESEQSQSSMGDQRFGPTVTVSLSQLPSESPSALYSHNNSLFQEQLFLPLQSQGVDHEGGVTRLPLLILSPNRIPRTPSSHSAETYPTCLQTTPTPKSSDTPTEIPLLQPQWLASYSSRKKNIKSSYTTTAKSPINVAFGEITTALPKSLSCETKSELDGVNPNGSTAPILIYQRADVQLYKQNKALSHTFMNNDCKNSSAVTASIKRHLSVDEPSIVTHLISGNPVANRLDSPAKFSPSKTDHDFEINTKNRSSGCFLHPHHCKPCAFFWTKGCINSTNCQFCHEWHLPKKKKPMKDQKNLMIIARPDGKIEFLRCTIQEALGGS